MQNTTVSQAIDVKVNANLAVSVGISDSEVNMSALEDGFTITSTALTVATNSPSGYTIYIRSDNDTSSLVSATGREVPAVAGSQIPNDFDVNTWGYVITKDQLDADTKYTGISPTQTKVTKTDTISSDTYTLGFGARTDRTLPVGTYTNNVIVSAVANPLQVSNLTQLVYMQDMKPEYCTNTRAANGDTTITPGNEVTKQLIDIRDGKEYWVAKLADGNCWMTQNLALDIDATRGAKHADGSGYTALTNENTDLNSKTFWNNTSNAYRPVTTSSTTAVVTSSDTGTGSVNFGDWVAAIPNDSTVCTRTGSELLAHISQCGEHGFVNVDTGYTGGFQAQAGTWGGINYDLVAIDENNKTYDEHYLVGNYYQWNAATAGSGGTLASGVAPDSICPKNWRLPDSGDDTTSGSFGLLFSKYGIYNSLTSSSGNVGGKTYYVTGAPFYYLRSGDIYAPTSGGPLNGLGGVGFYWSRNPYNIASQPLSVRRLRFERAKFEPSSYSARSAAFPVRCVVR